MADALYNLTLHGVHNGQHNECGFYFAGSNLTQEDTYENARDLVLSFEDTTIGLWQGLLPNTYELKRSSAHRVLPKGGVTFNSDYSAGSRVGTLGAQASGNQLCPIVRLIPPMAMKTGNRVFLPCIGENQIDANSPLATWETALGDFMANIMSNMGINAIIWLSAVYSKKTGVYLPTASYDTSSTVGWMMKRAKPH